MERRKRSHPYRQLFEGPVYRPIFDQATRTITYHYAGHYRAINGRPYGGLSPDWLSKLEPYAPVSITDDFGRRLETILTNYIRDRAGELAGIPWRDKDRGLFDGVEAIESAAGALLSAIDKAVPATTYIWQRLEQIEEPHFSRDAFYPQLSQLVRRTRLLLRELEKEEKRGDALVMKSAWFNFVLGVASIYREMGGTVTTPELSSANADTTKASPFLLIAHAAMLQVPDDLREHTAGDGENGLHSFSGALSETVTKISDAYSKIGVKMNLRDNQTNGPRISRKIAGKK
jgi:hypothetical protein